MCSDDVNYACICNLSKQSWKTQQSFPVHKNVDYLFTVNLDFSFGDEKNIYFHFTFSQKLRKQKRLMSPALQS